MLAMNMFFLAGAGTYGLTVVRRRTNVSGSRKLKTYTLDLQQDGAGLDTRLRKVESVEVSSTAVSNVTRGTTRDGKVLLTFHLAVPATVPTGLRVHVTGN